MSKQKHEPLSYTPHFHEATENIQDASGEPFISLLNIPSTLEHYEQNVARSGRQLYFDIEKFKQEHQADIARLNAEYEREEVLESGDSQRLGIRVVNEGEKPSIIVFTPWSTNSSWQNTKGIVESLALTMPDYQIVYVDTPGMGKSTKVSSSRMAVMKETGSFIPMAEQVVDCLETIDLDVAVVCGISEGAREAIAVGAELGNVDVITLDGPGTTELSFPQIMWGFSVTGANQQKQVMALGPDVEMREAHKADQKKFLPELARAALMQNRLLARVTAMRKSGLENDVKAAVQSGCRVLDYRSETSAVGDTSVASYLSRQIKGYDVLVLPNAPHSIVETNPYAVAVLVKNGVELRRTHSI